MQCSCPDHKMGCQEMVFHLSEARSSSELPGQLTHEGCSGRQTYGGWEAALCYKFHATGHLIGVRIPSSSYTQRRIDDGCSLLFFQDVACPTPHACCADIHCEIGIWLEHLLSAGAPDARIASGQKSALVDFASGKGGPRTLLHTCAAGSMQ